MTETKKTFRSRIAGNIETAVPLVFLVIFLIAFLVLISQRSAQNAIGSVKLVLNKSLPYIVAGMGTLFVTALGGTDITQGALLAFIFSVVVTTGGALGGAVGIILGLLTGALCGFVLGTINAKCRVPSFMVSLGLLIFCRALATMVGGTSYIDLPSFVTFFGNYYVSIPVTVVLFVLLTYVFHFTPFGHYTRAMGENENAVKFSGVNVDGVKIAAFTLSGVMTAVASLLELGTKSTLLPLTTGLGFEMSVLIAMFIGGNPVRGGYGCKIYMVVIGAFTVALMENVLGSLLLHDTYYVQLIKGVLLIFMLAQSSMLKRKTTKKAAETN